MKNEGQIFELNISLFVLKIGQGINDCMMSFINFHWRAEKVILNVSTQRSTTLECQEAAAT